MQLTFTIKHTGHLRKFREATELDNFIKSNKFTKGTQINFITDTNTNAGSLSVTEYLKREKKNNKATNSKTNILNTITN